MDHLPGFMNWLADQPMVALDTETTGVRPYHGDRLVGISIGTGEHNYYLPFRHEEGENLPIGHLSAVVAAMQDRQWVGWNAKFDLHMLAQEGYQIPTEGVLDAMLAAHLVNEHDKPFALKASGFAAFGPSAVRDEEELKAEIDERFGTRTKSGWKGLMWKLPAEKVEPYASNDTYLTWRLMEEYAKALSCYGTGYLFHEVCRYNLLVTRMEQLGIQLDVDRIESYRGALLPERDRVLAELRAMVGVSDFNPGSVPQLRRYFGWTKTARGVLETLDHPASRLVLDYRGLDKMDSAYYLPYLAAMDGEGVLRTNFQMTGTETGRLSSWQPNLQAVPRRTERARVKDVFMARPGYELLEIDLSQAELRVMAHYAQVQEMLDIFAAGRDLHTETAEQMQMPRDIAKRINLSAVYGIGPAKFADTYGIPQGEADKWLRVYHDQYPRVKQFYNQMIQTAKQQNFITLPTWRRRHYEWKTGDSGQYREHSKASSNYIQGCVAEIMRIAMVRLDDRFRDQDVRQLLTVHDSILFEIPAERPSGLVEDILAELLNFKDTPFAGIPLAADFKGPGSHWGLLKGD